RDRLRAGAGAASRTVNDGPAAGGRDDERVLLGDDPLRPVLCQLRRHLPHAPLADGGSRREQLPADSGGAADRGGGASPVRLARPAAEPAGARARQRRIARTRRGPRAARRLHQRVARDGRGRLDRRPDRFRRHHHSARDPPHRRPRSPPGAARGHALRRRFSGRLRSDRAYTARARRTARRHHHRPAGRPVLLMAPRQKTLIAVWLATLLALSAAASPRQQPAPSPGQQVRRIISLVPAVTEMLFAIGAGPRVVAVSSYDTYPPEVKGLPGVGALLDPNVERILSLKPDLVIVYGSQTDLMKQ